MSDVSRLPGPSIDAWEWQYQGACRDLDTELFFHPEGERGSTRRRRAAGAKAICATCPVIEQCREYALRAQEPYGIWGGMTEEERREEVQRRRIRRILTHFIRKQQTRSGRFPGEFLMLADYSPSRAPYNTLNSSPSIQAKGDQ